MKIKKKTRSNRGPVADPGCNGTLRESFRSNRCREGDCLVEHQGGKTQEGSFLPRLPLSARNSFMCSRDRPRTPRFWPNIPLASNSLTGPIISLTLSFLPSSFFSPVARDCSRAQHRRQEPVLWNNERLHAESEGDQSSSRRLWFILRHAKWRGWTADVLGRAHLFTGGPAALHRHEEVSRRCLSEVFNPSGRL